MLHPSSQAESHRQSPRRLWRLFWTLTIPFFRFSTGAKLNFLWVLFLLLLRSAFIVAFSFLSRDFWTALQHKDLSSFWHLLRLFTLLLFCALPTLVWTDYAQARLALRWRRWLSSKVLADYFAYRNYYHLNVSSPRVDNPDQRIADDLHAFTAVALSFFMHVARAFIDLVNFSLILFSIYPSLFVVLLVYATAGTGLAILIGRRLVHLNFMQLLREADFRYSLIRVRDNAEAIAFYNGETPEHLETRRRLDHALLNKVHLLIATRNLAFFTESYSYVVDILPLAIIAPLYFDNRIEMGVVSQASQAFRHVLSDLSIIVNQFERISAFSAGVDRLGELHHFMYHRFQDVARKHGDHVVVSEDDDTYGRAYSLRSFRSNLRRRDGRVAQTDKTTREIEDDDEDRVGDVEDGKDEMKLMDLLQEDPGEGIQSSIIAEEADCVLKVSQLTLVTPDAQQTTLLRNVSFDMPTGARLLIMGPSGTGKSSLLRAIAGLWTRGTGDISRPSKKDMLFVPQRPYCTVGTLREQLLYPRAATRSEEEEAVVGEVVRKVGLQAVVGRLGGVEGVQDWTRVLSLGEQQRVAFARALVHRPRLLVLDECSSALDVESERAMYGLLAEAGCAYVSVGHRPSLVHFHDLLLRVEPLADAAGGATCALERIAPSASRRTDGGG